MELEGKQIIKRYKVIFKNGEKHRLQLMVNNFKWHFFFHIFILSIEDSEDLVSQLSLLCSCQGLKYSDDKESHLSNKVWVHGA